MPEFALFQSVSRIVITYFMSIAYSQPTSLFNSLHSCPQVPGRCLDLQDPDAESDDAASSAAPEDPPIADAAADIDDDDDGHEDDHEDDDDDMGPDADTEGHDADDHEGEGEEPNALVAIESSSEHGDQEIPASNEAVCGSPPASLSSLKSFSPDTLAGTLEACDGAIAAVRDLQIQQEKKDAQDNARREYLMKVSGMDTAPLKRQGTVGMSEIPNEDCIESTENKGFDTLPSSLPLDPVGVDATAPVPASEVAAASADPKSSEVGLGLDGLDTIGDTQIHELHSKIADLKRRKTALILGIRFKKMWPPCCTTLDISVWTI